LTLIFVEEYLKGIKVNEKAVIDKSEKIEQAQKAFMGAITCIPVFSALVIATYLIGDV
jgi:hypothetical protein